MPSKTNNYNVESLKGQAIAKQFRDTVEEVKKKIGQRMFECALR